LDSRLFFEKPIGCVVRQLREIGRADRAFFKASQQTGYQSDMEVAERSQTALNVVQSSDLRVLAGCARAPPL